MSTIPQFSLLGERQDKPSAYRLLILQPDGTLVSNLPLRVENDEQARATARAMVNGHAVELWDGLRFIEHFDAEDAVT